METFFDHSPSSEEVQWLVGNLSLQDYLEELESSPSGENLLFIALLYKERGDNDMFEKYKNRIPDLYQSWSLKADYFIAPTA